jgi:hypothetical protein
MSNPPIPYAPSVETPEKDEAETIRSLLETFKTIQDTTSKDYDHAVRGVHAKSHAILDAVLDVPDGWPTELAQGLFSTPGRYRAIMRFSTNPGDILDDSISVPRGLAIKIIDVPGARLPGSEDATTQDFVMVNGPAFAAPTAKAFLANLKLLAKTTDKAEGAKKVLSAALRGLESIVELTGAKSAMLQQMGGAANVHPLGETYYTQTPYRYGDYIAKFSLAPVSPTLTEVTGMKINTHDRPDALREDIRETMIEANAVWELRVQLCRDLENMPIEDASALWDEKLSPFVTVATLTAPAQLSWSPDRGRYGDDQLRFSPWTGLAAHRPLGSINRARKPTYEASSGFRADFNRCPIHEPVAEETVPG